MFAIIIASGRYFEQRKPVFLACWTAKKSQLRPGMYLKLKFQYIIQTAPEQSDFLEEILEPICVAVYTVAINIDVFSDELFASRDTYKL
jgi:hypothetical protein